jgi:DNA replication protein DnaC
LATRPAATTARSPYVRFTRLLDELALARSDGRISSWLKSLGSVELLSLDDWGLQH